MFKCTVNTVVMRSDTEYSVLFLWSTSAIEVFVTHVLYRTVSTITQLSLFSTRICTISSYDRHREPYVTVDSSAPLARNLTNSIQSYVMEKHREFGSGVMVLGRAHW